MKLIDADAFLKEYCEPYPHIYQAMSSAFKHAPTVDAIPITFIEEMKAWAVENDFALYASDLTHLLSVWAERKGE